MKQSTQKSPHSFLNKILTIIIKTKICQPAIIRCEPQHSPKSLNIPKPKRNILLPSKPPLISIVIPSFNQAYYLEKTIKSILDQKYPNLELIVVDGASTDGSKQIIESYSNDLHWWCSEPDSGQTNGLNKGFKHANGEIMAWLNADDQIPPGTLARVAHYMGKNADTDVVYGHRILIDEDDQEIGRWIMPAHNDRVLTWADFIPQETLYWRRSLWEQVGKKLDESFKFAMDWDLLLRFREVEAKIVRLPYFMGLFRVHARQKTSAQIDEIGFTEMQTLRVRCLGFPPQQYRIALGSVGYLFKARIIELLWKAGLIHYD